MKQIKKTKVISKKTNKSLIKKNRKSTSMLKTVKKKTKKPVKITSVKVIKKPKKNKVKLSITYE
jgi:hypothetical protein